jgi:hypothetical protein
MLVKSLAAFIVTLVAWVVIGVWGWYYPSNSRLLLFLVITVCLWVLCISFIALSYLNQEVDESDLQRVRGRE